MSVFQIGFADESKHTDHHEMYRGQYVNGKKCGYGVYTFVNGNQSLRRQQQRWNGPAGDLYNGEFNDDEMHGYGLYTFSHEGHYEGQWVMGVYEGVGTETFALGSTYHGQYREGSRSGWGVCRYYNGDYYEGQWKEGIREGRGMQQVGPIQFLCEDTWIDTSLFLLPSAQTKVTLWVTICTASATVMACTTSRMAIGTMGNMQTIFLMDTVESQSR